MTECERIEQITKNAGCKTGRESDEGDMKREDDEGDVGCGRGLRTKERDDDKRGRKYRIPRLHSSMRRSLRPPHARPFGGLGGSPLAFPFL